MPQATIMLWTAVKRKHRLVSSFVAVCLILIILKNFVWSEREVMVQKGITLHSVNLVNSKYLLINMTGNSSFAHHIPTPEDMVSKNSFVSDKTYHHRSKANYFSDLAESDYQVSVYTLAATLCMRTDCQAIVDIGCGEGTKLNTIKTMLPNVKCTGYDFGSNMETAKKKYPNIDFRELDLSIPQCKLDISNTALSNAIVISADVIEHLVDPSVCFLPLLTHLSSVSKSVIVSSLDREMTYRTLQRGPPRNKHHIREWTLTEAENMFLEFRMIPLLAGRVCKRPKACPPDKQGLNKYAAFMFSLTNAHTLLANNFPVHLCVFIVIQKHHLHQALLAEVIRYYQSEGADIVLISVGELNKLIYPAMREHFSVDNIDEVKLLIQGYTEDYNDRVTHTWFILTEPNEVVVPRDKALHKTTLKHYLGIIGDEYNSVGLSVLFRHKPEGPHLWEDKPFKMHSSHMWDINHIDSAYKPVGNAVRIWRQNGKILIFSMAETYLGDTLLMDVSYDERRVYPYNLISHRFHPSFEPTEGEVTKSSQLSVMLEANYCLQLAVSSIGSEEAHLLEHNLLY